jgi:ketosteroid isomerase-like protein
MSQENVEAFKRAVEAFKRRDVEAFLQDIDPDVEWHPGLAALLEGEAKMYRGHEVYRQLLRNLDEAFAEIDTEYSEIRDLGDRVLAIGRIRTRGKASGVETESAFCYLTEFRNGKAIRVRTYLDPKEALEAAGLSE